MIGHRCHPPLLLSCFLSQSLFHFSYSLSSLPSSVLPLLTLESSCISPLIKFLPRWALLHNDMASSLYRFWAKIAVSVHSVRAKRKMESPLSVCCACWHRDTVVTERWGHCHSFCLSLHHIFWNICFIFWFILHPVCLSHLLCTVYHVHSCELMPGCGCPVVCHHALTFQVSPKMTNFLFYTSSLERPHSKMKHSNCSQLHS